jgi:hypothetical protein
MKNGTAHVVPLTDAAIACLPPESTGQVFPGTASDYLDLWSYDSTLDRIHHALYMECREWDEREASPTAAIIDSHGYDAGKKINGKKRYILADTLGLLLPAIVHPADIQDRRPVAGTAWRSTPAFKARMG